METPTEFGPLLDICTVVVFSAIIWLAIANSRLQKKAEQKS